MFERVYLKTLMARITEPRKFIQVVMGPRQVGKTTMISQLLTKLSVPYSFESADAVLNTNSFWIDQIWDSARVKKKSAMADEFLLVIDEVQKVDNWSEVVKKQWDRDSREGTNIKVVLLGSSRLLIQRGLTESLAGRFETFNLGHWSFRKWRLLLDGALRSTSILEVIRARQVSLGTKRDGKTISMILLLKRVFRKTF